MGAVAEPQRTCVGCRARAAKRELLRVARDPASGLVVDLSAKLPGRGAYVHPQAVCASAALRHGTLGRALRTVVSGEEAARLEEDMMATLGAP